MMASPVSTVGFSLTDEHDPWDWTIEEVVSILCSPDNGNFPEPIGFAKAIRENRVWGGALLVEVTYANLKDDLGVKAMGERSSVLMMIRNLRLRSAKYRQHAQEASSLAALSHAALSTASPFPGSFQAPQFNLPLMRYLTEPMEPPRNREASRLPMGPPIHAGQADTNRVQAEEVQPSNLQLPEERSDQLYSPPPVLDPNNEADLNQAPELPPRLKSSGSPTADEDIQQRLDSRSSLGVENERTLRVGETYVVDETGRKRRKLWLSAPEITPNDAVDANEASRKVDLDIRTAVQQLPGDFTQTASEVRLLSIDSSIQGNGLQTIDDAGETVANPEECISARLSSPEVLNTIQKVNDTAEDHVAVEVATPPNPHPLSPVALSAPTDHDVSVADIFRLSEETDSARPDYQQNATDNFIQKQDSVWQPDVLHETEAVSEGDLSDGVRPASPDNLAASNETLTIATDLLQQSAVVELSSDHDELHAVDLPSEKPSQPGVVVVDLKGRKRLMPTLIVQPSVEQQDDRTPSPVDSPSSESAEPFIQTTTLGNTQEQAAVVTSGPSNIRKREPSQMYLGPKAMPVDEIFYGDTAMGEKITYQDTHHAIVPLGTDADRLDDWVLLSKNLFPNGQRKYVNDRMKYFFSSRPISLGASGLPLQYGVVPYPARILKKHLPLSLTLFSSSAADDGAKRVRRPVWLAKDAPNPSMKASQDQSDGVHTFDVPQDSFLLSQLGENEIRDFDYLEKWNYLENGQKALPVYGDSGSEGEYDLDTWQEMEEEQSNKLERPVGRSRGTLLAADAVSEIIDDSIEQMAEEWKIKKLPLLAHKAWRLWARSRRDKSSQHQIASSAEQITRLEHRLTKLKKKLQGEDWSNALQLKKQCKSLSRTIDDLEVSMWTISTLQLKQAPLKPDTTPGKRASGKARKWESLPEGEEELHSSEGADESSGSDLDGFIVEDDMVSDGSRDDESVDMSLDDDEDVSAQIGSDTVAHGDGDNPINYSDDIIDPGDDIIDYVSDTINLGDDIRRTSVLNANSDSPTRSTTSSPLPGLDDVTTEESTTPGALNGGATNKESRLEVNDAKSPAKQGATLKDVIDLTQLSDPDTPEVPRPPTPRIKQEIYKIRTPPRDNADPFKRARKAKPEFREPPIVSHIVDLESEEQSQDRGVPSPSKQQLPGLWELSKIEALKWELIAERQDRRRLLTWIMLHTRGEALEDVLTVTQHQTSVEIQPTIWKGLRAIRGHATKVREANSAGIMQVTSWYINWHNCKIFPERSGIPQSYVDSTLDNQTGFEEFYNFMLEIFSKLEADKLSKPSISSSTRGPYNKKRQIRLDGDPETRSTPRKKRKYVVLESQVAAELRSSAQERARERTERQTLLQKQLKLSGMDLGNASAKIVNGKSGEEMITIHPEIGSRIQQHQLDGIQFMWGEIVSDQAEMQGCLLAHTMGLGKTMQV